MNDSNYLQLEFCPMRKLLIAATLVVLGLTACKRVSPSEQNSSASQASAQPGTWPNLFQPTPKFGWKVVHEETFETHPLYTKYFALPGGTSKLRVKVHADMAILGGVLPRSVIPFIKRTLRTEDFSKMPCSLQWVDQTEVACNIDKEEREAFVVRDARAEGTMASGLFGFLKGSHKLAERAALPNKIQISLYSWQCIENCTKPE